VHRGRPIFGSPMSTPEERDRPLAVVVGVQLAGVSNEEHASSLQEIERLATTLGLRPIGRVTQRRATLGRIGLLGKGKRRPATSSAPPGSTGRMLDRTRR
jgi:hypothetical protein